MYNPAKITGVTFHKTRQLLKTESYIDVSMHPNFLFISYDAFFIIIIWLKYNCFFHCRVSPYSPSSWPRIRMTSILPSLPSEVRRAYPWQKRVLAPIETHPSFPLILKWIRLFSGSRRTLKRLPLVTSQSKHDICDTAPTLLVESNGLRKICLDLLFQAL